MRIATKNLSQRILNVGFAFVLALSSVTASVPFIFSQKTSAVGGVQIVDEADMNDWLFYNDENDTIDNNLGSFVTGPGTAPLGSGSAQISVSGTERRNLATYQFSGAILGDISELGYSTYNPSAGNGGGSDRAGYLQFNVDFNGSDTWQKRLTFLPSDNGTVAQDTWQTWDAINSGNALWRYSGAVWPGTSTNGSTPRTWSDILASYSGARVRVTDAFMGIRVGEPYVSGYTENLDNFFINVDGAKSIFDFEPDTTAPSVPEISSPTYGQFFESTPISNTWSVSTDDASGVDYYQIAYNYDDGHSFGSSTCPGVSMTGYSGFIGCRDVNGTSRNHTPGSSEQGGVTIWVRAVDNGGNVSAWSEPVHYYYGKSTLDAPTLVSPSGGTAVNGGPTQKWSHNSPGDVDHYVYESYSDAALTDMVYTTTTSNTQRTVGGTQNITIWWRVFAVDKDGNLTAPSEVRRLVIDNEAPLDPTLSGPANGVVMNGSSVTQSWNSASSDVDYYIYESYNDSGATSLRWHDTYSATSKTAHNVGDSTYWWRVKAVDFAGNESGWSALWKITIDNTLPDQVSGVHIMQNGLNLGTQAVVKDRDITVDWDDNSDANFDHYEYQADANKVAPYDFTTTVNTSERSGTIRDLDGTYNYRVRAVDAAGNTGPWSEWVSVTLDREAPVVEITSPATDGSLTNGDVQVQATVTDGNLRHYWYQIKKNGSVVKSQTVPSSGITDELLYTLTESGEYTITVAARDLAGGTSTSGNRSADVVKTIAIDKNSPVVELTAPLDGSLVSGTFDVLGLVSEDYELSHYNLSIYPDSTDLSDGGTHSSDRLNSTVGWGSGTVYDAGTSVSVSRSLDSTLLTDGTYQLRLAARDAAGNRDTSSVDGVASSVHVVGFTVDNTLPVINLIDYATSSNVITPNITADDTNGPLTYQWTANDADSASNVTISDDTALNPDFTVNVDGTYSFDLTVADAAGNTSTETFSFTYTTPVVPTSGGGGSETNNGGGDANDGFTVVALNQNNNQGSNDGEEVLGAQDQNSNDGSSSTGDNEKDVLGDSDQKSNGWTIFGLAWYWWLLILAALAAAGRWLYGKFATQE